MKPLRPHNYYGGTTCPGRATAQVSTIRTLIPEEDDMPLSNEDKTYLSGLVREHQDWEGRQLSWMIRHLLAEIVKHINAAGVVTREDVVTQATRIIEKLAGSGAVGISDGDIQRFAAALRTELDKTKFSS